MQSLWRRLCCIRNRVHVSENQLASISPGLFTVNHNFYSVPRDTATMFPKESPSYLNFVRSSPCKCFAFSMSENKTQIHNGFILSHNGISRYGTLGGEAPFRCMSTLGHPEVSDGQDSSAATPNIVHPQRIKFKRLDKTAKHIMNILDKEAVEKVRAEREIPDIKPGYIVQLKVEVPENKRRVSVLKGIVIARRNAGLNTTFRLRRLVAGVGVESVFPLYSPNIKEMKILDKKKVRRAKLYYLRDRMNPLKK